jgi:hypothetical protein
MGRPSSIVKTWPRVFHWPGREPIGRLPLSALEDLTTNGEGEAAGSAQPKDLLTAAAARMRPVCARNCNDALDEDR